MAEITASELLAQKAVEMATKYRNLRLTTFVLSRWCSPDKVLTEAQLQRLNEKLNQHPVLSWYEETLPSTRSKFAGKRCWIPEAIQDFPYAISGEIFCDWAEELDKSHGHSASSMKLYLEPVYNGSMERKVGRDPGFIIKFEKTLGKHGRWQVRPSNTLNEIVFNPTMTQLITYYVRS